MIMHSRPKTFVYLTMSGKDGSKDWLRFVEGKGRASYERLQEGTVTVVVLVIRHSALCAVFES